MLDTVAVATEDPNHEQPWADLGLKADEYQRIREILGRRLERRGVGAPLILGSVVLRGVGAPAAARAFARSRANAV